MCIYIEDKYFWGGLLKDIQGKGWGVNKLETTPPCKECFLSINIEKARTAIDVCCTKVKQGMDGGVYELFFWTPPKVTSHYL